MKLSGVKIYRLPIASHFSPSRTTADQRLTGKEALQRAYFFRNPVAKATAEEGLYRKTACGRRFSVFFLLSSRFQTLLLRPIYCKHKYICVRYGGDVVEMDDLCFVSYSLSCRQYGDDFVVLVTQHCTKWIKIAKEKQDKLQIVVGVSSVKRQSFLTLSLLLSSIASC